MMDKESTRLRNFARALVEGKRKTAMQICRRVLQDPKSKLIEGKRVVWERWHEELKHPDPVGGSHEMVRLIMNDVLSESDYLYLMDQYDADAQHLSLAYFDKLMSYRLMVFAKKLRDNSG